MTDDRDDTLDDRLQSRLHAAGATPSRAPDPLVIARIERTLRARHGARRPRVLAPVLAGVAAAVVVVALANEGSEPQAIGTAGTGRDSGAATTAPAPSDDDLGGSIDDAVSDDETPAAGGNDDDPVDATLPSVPDDRSDRDGDDVPTVTAPPGRAPDDTAAGPVDGPRTTTTTTRPATTDTRASTTTTTVESGDDEPVPTRIEARVRARGAQAVIGWTGDSRDDLVRWTIVRYTEPPDGTLGPAKEEVVLRDGAPGDRQFVDDPPARGEVSYVVRGHRRDGAVVARSARVALVR